MSGFSFGQVQQPTNPLFGSAPGSSAQPNSSSQSFSFNQPAASTGGGLFGTTAQSSSLFGSNQSAPNASSGLFGSNPSTTTAGSTSSLFGTTNSSTTTPGSSSLFGAANPSATSGSLFGSNPATTTSNSLFGSNPTTAGSLLFGPNPTTTGSSLLGAPPSSAPSTSLFGSGSLFSNTLPSSTLFSQQQTQQQQPPTSPFQELKDAYDPNNPNYRFRFYFYNYVDSPTTAVVQPQKPTVVPERLWAQAVADNPNPKCFVPVMASGFAALADRAKWQAERRELLLAKSTELLEECQRLSQRMALDGMSLVQEIRQREYRIALRLLRAVATLDQVRSASGLRDDSPSPQCTNNLAGLLERVNRLKAAISASGLATLDAAQRVIAADPETLARLQAILRAQQDQLSSLLDSLQRESEHLGNLALALETAALGSETSLL